jgi:Na+/melibiose symporter-like transporter
VEALTSETLLPIIQLSITPVILISGEGALMLTLTNRMGRIVDRTRSLAGQVRALAAGSAAKGGEDERKHLESQLEIMWRRALLIRRAVTFAGLSMLVACGLVLLTFATAVLEEDLSLPMMVFFMTSILLLIAALAAFLRDIYVSLHALRLEVGRARRGV